MRTAALTMKAALEEHGKFDIYGPSPMMQKRLADAIREIKSNPGEMKPRLQPITRAADPTMDKAAASIAVMVDEYTQRGWNDEGRADFAKMVKRRLSRFWPR